MKTFRIFLLSLILLLSLSTGVKAEFFSDVIVTSANGIWTDSRAYATLNAAITAVGANQRTIKIVSPQVVTSLTVPSNVTLEFDRDGSITNSGQLTINTKNIVAPNRQIFTGAGNIDFASGSIIKTGWFNSIESAFALTTNDTVTLIVSKAQTITASYSPGNNVNLKWESPGNILTINNGITVSNIGQIEAGPYQLFAGAGHFHFRDGPTLNLAWFSSSGAGNPAIRYAVTCIDTAKVTLLVNTPSTVDWTGVVAATTSVRIERGGLLTVSGGITLTISGDFSAGPYQVFVPTGTVILSSVVEYYPEWYSSGTFTQAIEAALTAIGTTNKVMLLLRPGNWVISTPIAFPANVTVKMPPGAYFSGAAVTAGTITGLKEATPEMFGLNTDPGTTNMFVAVQAAHNSVVAQNGVVHFAGRYNLTSATSLHWSPFVTAKSDGYVEFVTSTATGTFIHISSEYGGALVGARLSSVVMDGDFNLYNSNVANTMKVFLIGDTPPSSTYTANMLKARKLQINSFNGNVITVGNNAYGNEFDINTAQCDGNFFSATAPLVNSGAEWKFNSSQIWGDGYVVSITDSTNAYDLAFNGPFFEFSVLGMNDPAGVAPFATVTMTDCKFEDKVLMDEPYISIDNGIQFSLINPKFYVLNVSTSDPVIGLVNGTSQLSVIGARYHLPAGIGNLYTVNEAASRIRLDAIENYGGTFAPTTYLTITDPLSSVGYYGTTYTSGATTWVPSLEFGSDATGITYAVGGKTGYYFREGNIHYFYFSLTLTSKHNHVGAATITGLPITCAGSAGGSIGIAQNLTGLTGAVIMYAAGTQIGLAQWGATGITAITNTEFTDTTVISGTLIVTE